jgi:hypothetical protein
MFYVLSMPNKDGKLKVRLANNFNPRTGRPWAGDPREKFSIVNKLLNC